MAAQAWPAHRESGWHGARLNWQRSASEPEGMVTDTAANTQEKNQTAQYRPSLYWAPDEEKKSVRPSTGLLCALHEPCSLEKANPARQHTAHLPLTVLCCFAGTQHTQDQS